MELRMTTNESALPKEWETKKLGDLSVISSGGTPNRKIRTFWNGDIPWITTSRIDFCTITEAGEFITKEGLLKSAAQVYEAGTLLMAMYGQGKTRGKVGILGINAAINQACAAISLHKTVDKRFIFYNLSSRYDEIRNLSNTGNQENLNGHLIRSISISLPKSKSEQIAIATALSDADAMIAGLEKVIAKKRLIKQGVMQKLLEPKKGWEKKSLFEIADNSKKLFDDGDWIEAEHITDKGVRLIQTGNIGIGEFLDTEVKKYIYPKSFRDLKCKEIFQGDLLICRLADPAGRACVLPDLKEEKVITSVDVTIFRPRKEVANRIFLSNIFSTNNWLRSVGEMAGGTTHKRISRGALGRIRISLPSIQEQNEIAAILSDMDSEIKTLYNKLEKVKLQKQGMMQTLLTGKIRLV